jgi:hypothetical protein
MRVVEFLVECGIIPPFFRMDKHSTASNTNSVYRPNLIMSREKMTKVTIEKLKGMTCYVKCSMGGGKCKFWPDQIMVRTMTKME